MQKIKIKDEFTKLLGTHFPDDLHFTRNLHKCGILKVDVPAYSNPIYADLGSYYNLQFATLPSVIMG